MVGAGGVGTPVTARRGVAAEVVRVTVAWPQVGEAVVGGFLMRRLAPQWCELGCVPGRPVRRACSVGGSGLALLSGAGTAAVVVLGID